MGLELGVCVRDGLCETVEEGVPLALGEPVELRVCDWDGVAEPDGVCDLDRV